MMSTFKVIILGFIILMTNSAILAKGPALASFDMDSVNGGATLADWTSLMNQDSLSTPASTISGSIILTRSPVTGVSRDRGLTNTVDLTSNSLGDMLRDFVTAPADPLVFIISGLEADTQYTIRGYSFDADGNRDGLIVEWKDGLDNSLGTVTINNSAPSGCYLNMVLTSNSSGEIVVQAAGTTSNAWVNGIEIYESIQTLNVYLLGGQSNMDGRADIAELPAELQSPQTDVQIYFENAWQDLKPGLSYAEPNQSFGPEVTFGKYLADYYSQEKIALIKYARGGTSLANDWAPGTGAQYIAFVNTVNNALAGIAFGYDPKIVGMIWMQGERDSLYQSMANAYEQNLTDFIDAIRDEFSLLSLPFIIGQISESPTWTYGSMVRQAQLNVSQSVPNTALVTTSDLTLNADGIHYDASGQMTLGERFAQQVIPLKDVLICGEWGYPTGDINQDCIVDLSDLAELTATWMECSVPNQTGCDDYR